MESIKQVQNTHMKKINLKNIFNVLGPGFVTAALVLGPGSITVCSKAGAVYGYSFLWVILLSGLFMICYTRMVTRIGCINDKSLLTLIGENYGKVWPLLVGLSVFVSCAGFQTGNNIGIGISMQALFGGNISFWAFLFTLVSLLFIWTSRNFYNMLEKVMMLMVLVMIAAFVGNLFFIRPDIKEVGMGFLPTLPQDLSLMIAIASTSFSVAGAAGQCYMVQAKKWKINDLKKGLRDAMTGIIFLCTLSAIIIITSAAVLKPKGITVSSAIDMAMQLEPLLGVFAKWLFLIGLFAASFSSFLANSVLSGMFLADALGLGKTINDKWVKIFSSILLVVCSCIAALFNTNPVQLLIMAQATTCFGYPLIIIMLFMLSNNKKAMQGQTNKLATNLIAGVAILWIVFLSYHQFMSIIN